MNSIISPGCLPLKVCGLTRAEDASLCLELGAAFTGFIFAPGSPRRISAAMAASLPGGPEDAPAAAFPGRGAHAETPDSRMGSAFTAKGRAARVGVFAGQSAREIIAIMKEARLGYAQLHGGEGEEVCRAVGPERVIKTLWPEAPGFAENVARFTPLCAMFLLDSGKSGGGSGKILSPEVLRDFRPEKPWLLAGGLGPENARAALAIRVGQMKHGSADENSRAPFLHPLAVDCNSALEDAPGIKNHEKLKILAAELGAFQKQSPTTARPDSK